jgi:ATP-dependent RNA helicase DeaD
VLSGAGKEFQPLLEQIEADGNIPAIEIAAALASLMQGSTPLLLAQKPEGEAKPAPRIDGSVETQTYRLEVGHEHGVLPGNIVGAIANEAGIEGRHIGHIDIRDDHSYVDLPGLPDEMLGHLQKVKVRGAELRIKRVDSKPDKPKFSGKSRRPDRVAEEFRDTRPPKNRDYAGTPRYAAGDKPRFSTGDKPRYAAGDKPRFSRERAPGAADAGAAGTGSGDKPAYQGGFKKPFKKPFDKPFKKPFKKAGGFKSRKD